MLREIGRIVALCAAFILPIAAQAQVPAAPAAPVAAAPPPASAIAPAAAAGSAQEYVLGPEDVVEYDVVGTSDRSRARIYSDGTLQTNLGIRIPAAGLTPRLLGAEIAKALKSGGFYADPIVNVEVVGYASRYVTVLGAVGNPGLIPINREFHLSEILARVGGVRTDAADYLIVRPETGPEKRYFIEDLSAGGRDQDPVVKAGDKIFAPVAEIFYISGQVRSPGTYSVKANLTIAQAIGKAGGLTESGQGKKVKVLRGGKNLKLGSEAKVEAGDVLTVGERLF